MIKVTLMNGKYKVMPEKALKILKKKLIKEGLFREMKDRAYFVSKGRKNYLARNKAKHLNSFK